MSSLAGEDTGDWTLKRLGPATGIPLFAEKPAENISSPNSLKLFAVNRDSSRFVASDGDRISVGAVSGLVEAFANKSPVVPVGKEKKSTEPVVSVAWLANNRQILVRLASNVLQILDIDLELAYEINTFTSKKIAQIVPCQHSSAFVVQLADEPATLVGSVAELPSLDQPLLKLGSQITLSETKGTLVYVRDLGPADLYVVQPEDEEEDHQAFLVSHADSNQVTQIEEACLPLGDPDIPFAWFSGSVVSFPSENDFTLLSVCSRSIDVLLATSEGNYWPSDESNKLPFTTEDDDIVPVGADIVLHPNTSLNPLKSVDKAVDMPIWVLLTQEARLLAWQVVSVKAVERKTHALPKSAPDLPDFVLNNGPGETAEPESLSSSKSEDTNTSYDKSENTSKPEVTNKPDDTLDDTIKSGDKNKAEETSDTKNAVGTDKSEDLAKSDDTNKPEALNKLDDKPDANNLEDKKVSGPETAGAPAKKNPFDTGDKFKSSSWGLGQSSWATKQSSESAAPSLSFAAPTKPPAIAETKSTLVKPSPTSSSFDFAKAGTSNPFASFTPQKNPFAEESSKGGSGDDKNALGAPKEQPSIFGAPKEQKSVFGAPSVSPFGSDKPSPFSVTPKEQPSIFGAPKEQKSMFGTPKEQPSMFGAPKDQKSVFGAPKEQPSIFGAPKDQKSIFGAPKEQPSMFGAPKDQKSVFGAPKEQSSIFGAPKDQKSVFGAPKEQPSIFGAPKEQKSAFGAPNASPFSSEKPSAFSTGDAKTRSFGTSSTPLDSKKLDNFEDSKASSVPGSDASADSSLEELNSSSGSDSNESDLDESSIDENNVNGRYVDESIADESVLDESIADESAANESNVDDHYVGKSEVDQSKANKGNVNESDAAVPSQRDLVSVERPELMERQAEFQKKEEELAAKLNDLSVKEQQLREWEMSLTEKQRKQQDQEAQLQREARARAEVTHKAEQAEAKKLADQQKEAELQRQQAKKQERLVTQTTWTEEYGPHQDLGQMLVPKLQEIQNLTEMDRVYAAANIWFQCLDYQLATDRAPLLPENQASSLAAQLTSLSEQVTGESHRSQTLLHELAQLTPAIQRLANESIECHTRLNSLIEGSSAVAYELRPMLFESAIVKAALDRKLKGLTQKIQQTQMELVVAQVHRDPGLVDFGNLTMTIDTLDQRLHTLSARLDRLASASSATATRTTSHDWQSQRRDQARRSDNILHKLMNHAPVQKNLQ